MAGFTGFTVGHINGRLSYIPLDEICKEGSGRRIKSEDRAW
jgi:6-phosphofructokinase 1